MSKNKSKVLLLSCVATFSTSAFASGASVDPMACTDEELQVYFDNYKSGLKNHISMTKKPDYNQIKQADIARRALSGDPDERESSLCAVITNPDFDMAKLVPDMSFVTDAYKAMQAWYASDSAGGVDYATVISQGVAAGVEYAREKAREGYCNLAKKLPSAIDHVAYDLYDTAVAEGKNVVLSDEAVESLGITNFEDPIWQQMAGEQLDQQLEDYSDYAKWYEDGWTVEDAVGGATDDTLDDQKDSWLDHLEDTDPALDDDIPYL